jgi:hypothetical protein
MKSNPSSYVLAVEILIVTLFHVVKIKQAEKHPEEIVFTRAIKAIPLHKPVVENKSGTEYMLVNLIK